MHSISTDMKRAFTSWGFWAGVIGMVIAIVIGAFDKFMSLGSATANLQQGFHETALLDALSTDTVMLVVPILCALPFTAAFVDDYKSGYIKYYLQRSGKRRYIAAKAVTTGLSGGMVLFTGIAAAYVVFMLVFTPAETLSVQSTGMSALDPGPTAPPSIFADILSRALIFLLCGAFWALIGQLFASFTMSKYVAYASPFILYYVLVILSVRYLKDIYVLNPQGWLNPAAEGKWPGEGWSGILFLIEMIFAAGLGFAYAAGRKLKND